MATNLPRTRKPSELLKRGYSEEEITSLYELGRFLLESGDLFRAEVVLKGASTIAPEYIWPKSALSYVALMQQNYDIALARAEEALKIIADHPESLLYKCTALLELGELSSAGMTLGSLQDSEQSLPPPCRRLLKILIAKFDLSQRPQS